ncbi:BgTH12-05974 [Blumeria graminis f. sp. triticale]|uniref:Bgt-5123 n=3 Tax=Blumeria graminis TaxID=34373 RepID=A0A381LHM8_BLUGR|nr:debranching enzyme [Blumeria graminis f. sp. tritici 96224]CAD6504241.1 BgTH12-05974 [Blumeria graminis f. sp. triticale]VDB91057.1 Bgt-5123 [Blumeria graminis f. sp. tritici]
MTCKMLVFFILHALNQDSSTAVIRYKLIVIGDVNGQLHPIFSRLAALHTKNNFNLAIIAGNLFSEDQAHTTELFAGNVFIPFPTYFTVGSNPLPQLIVDKIEKNEEIYPNLYYLGKRCTTTTSDGVKIVTLGGKPGDPIVGGLSQDQYLPLHTVADAKALYGNTSADILLTNCWPAGIRNGSRVPVANDSMLPVGYKHISDLCAAIKPRYHFSVSPSLFFEREPFYQDLIQNAPGNNQITRFLSLASYGTSKQKFMYAFNLSLPVNSSSPAPTGVTNPPWNLERCIRKRPASDVDPFSRYGQPSIKRNRGTHSRSQRDNKFQPPGPGECFFCLSNPSIATHLISSIGEDSYLTIAKGPLTTSTTNAHFGICFPAHVLIVPLAHSPNLASIPEEENAREKTFTEMTRFRISIQNMIASNSGNKLGTITYEISKTNGVHIHWQLIPISEKLVREGLVEAAFRVEADNLSYPAFLDRDLGLGLHEGNFFRLWLWAPPNGEKIEETSKCITMFFEQDFKFSLQYGRTVLAKLLGLEQRIQWRDCVQSEDEEKRDIRMFKAAFREFDFTL